MDQDSPLPNHSTARVETVHRSAGPAVATPPPRERRPRHHPRHRSGARWFVWLIGCLLAALLLALLACALVGGLVVGIAIKLANQVTATTTTTQSLAVSDTPSLDIHNAAGQVRVQPGAPGVVSIQITRTARDASESAARADLDKIAVDVTQTGNQIAITSDFQGEGFFASSSSVDLLITVPPSANIAADVTAGALQIGGVSGLIEVTGGAGDATLQDVTLADGSWIHVATGSVTISGSTPAHGALDISVNTGDVTLQLPADTAARLDARTNVGDIHIMGWPLQPTRLNTVGAMATGALGAQTSSLGTIHIRVDAGDITVSQQ